MSSSSRRTLAGLSAVSAVGLLVGLVPGAARPAARGGPWLRSGLGAIGQPAPVGRRFVLLTHHDGSLQVVALNAADGSTAWTAAASPSDSTAGQPATLTVSDDVVFYLGRAGAYPGAAQLVARDVASGDVLWQTPVASFSNWPGICPDEQAVICVTGSPQKGSVGELRFAAATGKPLATLKVGTTTDPGRELGANLFDSGQRSPEVLVSVNGRRIAWRRPVSEIFTLPHASSDGGWDFSRLPRLGLYIGSVGTTPRISGGKATANLSVSMTAGFAVSSGEVAWRAHGEYVCTVLPCPGDVEASYSSPAAVDAPGPTVALRLVETGTATAFVSGGPPHVSRDASVTIQGFDPATGKTVWSFDAGRNIGLMSLLTIPPRLDQDTIVVGDGAQRVALNLRNGSRRPVSATAAAWCEGMILYRLSHTAYYGGKGGQYAGAGGLFACSADGHRRATPAKLPGLVRAVGATADGMTGWTDTNGTVRAQPSP